MNDPRKQIVGLAGSLRAHSSNALLVRAALARLPPELAGSLYDGIGRLPHFNPDLDQEGDVAPPAVAELRARLGAAAGFIVSVPEYAHGLPGAFKNALDWLVSSGELAHKPLLVLNASAGGQHAQANLVETLTVLEAPPLPASRLAPFLQARLLPDGALADADGAAVQRSVDALAAEVAR